MAAQITNYQCPACTGPLHFAGESGMLECDYCGSKYTVAEIEELYKEKDAAAAAAQAAAEAKEEAAQAAAAETDDNEQWDFASSMWGAEAADLKVYNCPSCGAELICDATTAATSCPYCGNPSIVPGQFRDTLKPDYVIPFKLDKNAAVSALKNFYKGKTLLPRAFSDNNHIEEIKGVYVPFWLFDGKADADIRFQATRVHTFTQGNTLVTRTDHYRLRRAGTVDFEKIPVDASSKMPDAHMDAIEPYDYSALKPFSTAYLPGYMADIYDVEVEECSERADLRARNTAVSIIGSTVSGYSSVMPEQQNVRIRRGSVKYALLPVWMLSTRWNGQNYLFAMNGQTGKLIGDLPVSRQKMLTVFAAIAAPLAALLGFLFY